MKLLKDMCAVHAPSGDEVKMKKFVLDYIQKNKANWKVQPEVFHGKGFQDCVVLVFGKPKTAIFAHLDSIGYTVKYDNELVKIGGPIIRDGIELVGEDSQGKIDTTLRINENVISVDYNRKIERGTSLTYKPKFIETEDYVQCCYMDNRLGVWNALQVAEDLEDGILCFSCWEEHGGGSVGYLSKFIYEKYDVSQALISDITWVTKGVQHGKGVAVSMRDSGLPRVSFVNKIIGLAKESNIPFQLEVEDAGGSDGNAIQKSPYPIDWCFIGAPEDNVHSPEEKVHKDDIKAMVDLYKVLMKKL
jgi:putative aminopeptidase FrvX